MSFNVVAFFCYVFFVISLQKVLGSQKNYLLRGKTRISVLSIIYFKKKSENVTFQAKSIPTPVL